MPLTFGERELSFEAKFAHDEAFRFRATARRDRLVAQWAAVTLGLGFEASEALVKEMLAIPDGPGHDQAVLQHLSDVLQAGNAGVLDLPGVLEKFQTRAVRQLTGTSLD